MHWLCFVCCFFAFRAPNQATTLAQPLPNFGVFPLWPSVQSTNQHLRVPGHRWTIPWRQLTWTRITCTWQNWRRGERRRRLTKLKWNRWVSAEQHRYMDRWLSTYSHIFCCCNACFHMFLSPHSVIIRISELSSRIIRDQCLWSLITYFNTKPMCKCVRVWHFRSALIYYCT